VEGMCAAISVFLLETERNLYLELMGTRLTSHAEEEQRPSRPTTRAIERFRFMQQPFDREGTRHMLETTWLCTDEHDRYYERLRAPGRRRWPLIEDSGGSASEYRTGSQVSPCPGLESMAQQDDVTSPRQRDVHR
jgi:hypothetical protein